MAYKDVAPRGSEHAFEHGVVALIEDWPVGHAVQDAAPLLTTPIPAPTSATAPGWQTEQLVMPVCCWYLPAAHSEQGAVDKLPYLPTAHGTQAVGSNTMTVVVTVIFTGCDGGAAHDDDHDDDDGDDDENDDDDDDKFEAG